MRRQRFLSAARDQIIAKALMRHALLNNPSTLAALNRYIASFQLQRRINSGELSGVEALILFEQAIHNFARRLHTELNKQWAAQNIDQTDLSNPLNMQNALNNPISMASELMNSIAAAIEEAAINEAYQNEQANMQTAQENEQAAQAQNAALEESTENTAPSMVAKTTVLVEAITLFDERGPEAAKDTIESAFFKETGVKTEFHKEEEPHEVSSILKNVLKPEFKDFQKEDDKNKG